MRVIGIGDNVCDKYEHQQTMYPGGQTLNFTIYARMLGVESSYIGVFGTDDVAEHVMATLDKYQVDRSRCRQYEGENGCARVTLVDGDRVFLGSNKGGVLKDHPIELEDADLEYASQFAVCHTSNNSYMDGQLPRLKQAGVSVSYDFSGQWVDAERVERVAPYIDYAFVSCGSATQEMAADICRMISAKGTGMVIATRGSDGAMLYDGADFYTQPPDLVEAVDTLGAGDSFATAFLLEWLKDKDQAGKDPATRASRIQQAMKKAAAFSAKTCLVYGAFGEGKAFTPVCSG